MSEIGQLRITDISKKNRAINISSAGTDQSLKTIYSARTLPIHPKLIEIGFFEYVEDVAKLQQWGLFPNLKPTINGYGTRISNDFTRYLEKIGIKQERKLSRIKTTSGLLSSAENPPDISEKILHSSRKTPNTMSR